MSNLRKNNKHNPLLKLNYDDYWDFTSTTMKYTIVAAIIMANIMMMPIL